MTRPDATLRTLAAKGITHVVGLPDRISAAIFAVAAKHPAIRLVTTTRGGEAFAVGTGLWIGGAEPLVIIRDTALLGSGSGLHGTAQRLGAPLPIIVTRPDPSSTAPTGATLSAWDVPFTTTDPDADPAEALARTVETAREHHRPAALVVSTPMG